MERFEAAFFSLERQATLISAIGATPDPGFRIPNKGPVSVIAPALPGCTLKTGSVPSRANVNEDKKMRTVASSAPPSHVAKANQACSSTAVDHSVDHSSIGRSFEPAWPRIWRASRRCICCTRVLKYSTLYELCGHVLVYLLRVRLVVRI